MRGAVGSSGSGEFERRREEPGAGSGTLGSAARVGAASASRGIDGGTKRGRGRNGDGGTGDETGTQLVFRLGPRRRLQLRRRPRPPRLRRLRRRHRRDQPGSGGPVQVHRPRVRRGHRTVLQPGALVRPDDGDLDEPGPAGVRRQGREPVSVRRKRPDERDGPDRRGLGTLGMENRFL